MQEYLFSNFVDFIVQWLFRFISELNKINFLQQISSRSLTWYFTYIYQITIFRVLPYFNKTFVFRKLQLIIFNAEVWEIMNSFLLMKYSFQFGTGFVLNFERTIFPFQSWFSFSRWLEKYLVQYANSCAQSNDILFGASTSRLHQIMIAESGLTSGFKCYYFWIWIDSVVCWYLADQWLGFQRKPSELIQW